MKILEINLKKKIVKVIPEVMDDLWHLYNVIFSNDTIYASSSREIKPDEEYARPKKGKRISIFIGLKVEKMLWDKFSGSLRIHGIISDAPEIIPKGVHHTLNITLNTPLTIVKSWWTSQQIERLQNAVKASKNKQLIIFAIDDEGFAIATTTQYGIKIEVEDSIKIPGKYEQEKRDNALKAYYNRCLKSLRQIWLTKLNPIAIIGLNLIKNDFIKYLKSEASDIANSVVEIKSVNNGGVAGIHEAIRSGILSKAMEKQRITEETEVIEEMLKRLGKGNPNVTYGLKDVEKAALLGAIEKLIITDKFLRESSIESLKFIEDMMRSVEQKRGDVIVISTEHEAGLKLISLGGIAALLRFALNYL